MVKRLYSDDFLLDRLLYRDGLMLVVNKPEGLAVHRGPSGGECLEDYFDALRFGLPRPPALAHRLDRDTTGCLILGRHPKALRRLGRLFQNGQISKVYRAIVHGAPAKMSGRIDTALKKETTGRNWRMATVSEDDVSGEDKALPAATTYRVLSNSEAYSLIEAKPKTGRTHQIRVHLASIGCPIIGDTQYGYEESTETLKLHAARVSVPLYKTREPIHVEAKAPESFTAFADAVGLNAAGSKGARSD
ncbi:MAG: RNA pseudouridine synthase [Pseudomonadota bacterium]